MYTKHFWVDGNKIDTPIGKVICIASNYYDHIMELNNPIPKVPVFFMKPQNSLQNITDPIIIPNFGNSCHHEVELSILIGKNLKNANKDQALDAILGLGIALDLTMRDIQNELKEKGFPWEKAKAFDGSCPLSPFIKKDQLPNYQDVNLAFYVNNKERQNDSTKLMINPVLDIIQEISKYFTIDKGDVILTGTPKGVGEIKSGDAIKVVLDHTYEFSTLVR